VKKNEKRIETMLKTGRKYKIKLYGFTLEIKVCIFCENSKYISSNYKNCLGNIKLGSCCPAFGVAIKKKPNIFIFELLQNEHFCIKKSMQGSLKNNLFKTLAEDKARKKIYI
jgi:hypothetical protein